jgi:hypothetical protein
MAAPPIPEAQLEERQMSLSLPEQLLTHYAYEAQMRCIPRETLIREVLMTAAVGFSPLPPNAGNQPHMLPEIKAALHTAIRALPIGAETSLKKLLDQPVWQSLHNTFRRDLGKIFKEFVQAGEFPGLSVGRKKSNNEQQYLKT